MGSEPPGVGEGVTTEDDDRNATHQINPERRCKLCKCTIVFTWGSLLCHLVQRCCPGEGVKVSPSP